MEKKKESFSSPSYPYGKCLHGEIWRQDPTHVWTKFAMAGGTSVGLSTLWCLPRILISRGLDGTWDARHDINSFLGLMQSTLGLSEATAQFCIMSTMVCTIALVVLDAALGARQPYPRSWNTENTKCYHEMFAEPTRQGRLIRRPGNALSNVSYLLASFAILASCWSSNNNSFVLADGLFGVMILILSVSSFLWHASNSPTSHYVDLWSMDACILYLLIRYAFVGLASFASTENHLTRFLAGCTCFVIYVFTVSSLGVSTYRKYQKGWLLGGCPFSVRARLLKQSNGNGHVDISVITVYGFAFLPVVYSVIPVVVLLYSSRGGSIYAANITFRSLVLGWTPRLWERWAVDGNCFMNLMLKKPRVTLGAALVSPTALLHAFTGITLLAGYMHVRSIDSDIQ